MRYKITARRCTGQRAVLSLSLANTHTYIRIHIARKPTSVYAKTGEGRHAMQPVQRAAIKSEHNRLFATHREQKMNKDLRYHLLAVLARVAHLH